MFELNYLLWNDGLSKLTDFFSAIYGATPSLVQNALSGLTDIVTNGYSSVFGLLQSAGYLLLQNTISLLPDGGAFPTVVHDSFTVLGSYMSSLSFIFPVYDLILILSIIISIKFVYFSLSIFRSIVSLVRGVQMPKI